MDANRVLNATLNGAASGAAVYLAGRIGGYRFPRVAAALVGTAVGVGSYRAMADVDFEAIAEAAADADVTIGESGTVDVPVSKPGDADADTEVSPRRRTEVLSSAVEHAMGFGRADDESSA